MSEPKTQTQELLNLERSLKTRLYPVKPDQEFVGDLQQRLTQSPVYDRQHRLAATLMTIAAGLMTGLVIFFLGRGFLNQTGNSS